MTRSHEPLIRLARFKVEELQKQMAELDRSRAALIGQIERLEASVPEEQAAGARMMMGLFAVPGDGEDTLTSTIEVKGDGQILANGQRIK